MKPVAFAAYVLATWRLSSLLVKENGPARMFALVRERVGANEPGEMIGLAELFSCIWCMSVWAAAAIYLLRRLRWPVYILAASAGAILIDSRARNL